MKKFLITLSIFVATTCFADIVGEVKEVKKDSGNLIIKVVFYEKSAPEVKLAEEQFYIADNQVAEENLKEAISKKIKIIKSKTTETKAEEPIKANIKAGLIIDEHKQIRQ